MSAAHRAPFDPGGEGRTATATQAGIEHRRRGLLAANGDGLGQTLETAVGPVILKGQRPGNAGTGEQQALLSLQIRQFFHQAQGQRMSGRLAL
ncbi:hypothetical protein D3C81_1899710 [compost metagenome]